MDQDNGATEAKEQGAKPMMIERTADQNEGDETHCNDCDFVGLCNEIRTNHPTLGMFGNQVYLTLCDACLEELRRHLS